MDIVQRTTKAQRKDTNMEQDYSIDRDFLSKINNAMTIKAKEMPLPAMVQVGDVEKLDERLNLLELCDGEHIMSHLVQKVGVLTRQDISKFSVISVVSACIALSEEEEEERENLNKLFEKSFSNTMKEDDSDSYAAKSIQKLLGKSTFKKLKEKNPGIFAILLLEDVTVIEEGSVIGHLLWDKAGLKICDKAGHKKSAAIRKENECSQDSREGISLQFLTLLSLPSFCRCGQFPISLRRAVTSGS